MAARWMTPLVEPPSASSTRAAFSIAPAVMILSGVRSDRASATARAPVASAARSRSACTAGIAAVPGSVMPSASAMAAMVEAVPMTAQVPAVVTSRPSTASMLGLVELAGAELRPELAAVGAGADAVVLVARGHLRAADQLDGGLAGAGRAHQLRRHGLVAAAHQHHRVHRLGADHLLGVHGHEVAELHGVGGERGLVQRDGGELERQPAGRRHAALDGVEQLGEVAVAGIEPRVRVGDADDGAGQLLARVAHRLGERAPHVDGEVAVAVGLQLAQEPALGLVLAIS